MWKKSKQSISAGDDSTNVIAGRDVNLYFEGNFPTKLIDQKIKEEIDKLIKSRFFMEFDRIRSSLRLGIALTQGNLTGGSDEVRGPALAWCAKLLSRSEEIARAEEYLELTKTLGDFSETKIAEAFIASQKGSKAAALQALAGINSDASRSAGMMVVTHHEGAESALKWINDAGYRPDELDSAGRSFLLNQQLQLGRWDDVAQTVEALFEADFEESPILYHLAALATLVPTVPREFRAVVISQVPFEALRFPLASDAVAMDARRAAHNFFLDGVNAATRLACPRAARMDDEYALWLELRDPAQAAHGKNRLESKLRDPVTALSVVHYALQFGLKLDVEAVERDIDREIAKNSGMTLDAAIARFALAFTKTTAEEVANYIARHQNQLAAHIDLKLLQLRQVEMFSHAGLVAQANEALEKLVEKGITAEEERTLRRIISEAQRHDSIEFHKTQYKLTGGLDDLIHLVAELEKHQQWDDLCEFGMMLFHETRSLEDAERLVIALNNTHKSAELVGFLTDNRDLLSQSNHLCISYAWGLYHEGALLESRAALSELSDEVDDRIYRALQVNLGIATGDWASLFAYIVDEYRNRSDRSAQDLIGAAQLALHLGSPHAKDLVFEAAVKADDDSAVLAAAYFMATSAGWEDDPQVFKWLEKAAALSGDDGPLQSMSLKDVLDRKPEWDRHESETLGLLAKGQLPMFLAAQSLNRTLVDLMTFPALANFMETDPRRRSAIPAYSGKRVPLEFDIRGKAAALDAIALLTLSFLEVLDIALDAFETVYIPHSTLGWLFEERQKAKFHQPSRITNARKVRDFLATDILEKFTLSTVASSDLSAQIGNELASLIAEAEKVRDGDDTQHIVVRSAPVHRISSLMEEEVDLSEHAAVLSSCLAVVEKLRQKGQLTADEEKRARAYLHLHERPWPNQPDIADGATLYLDDVAISYFLHLGILGKLKAVGLTAVVSPSELSAADALISYERISEEVKGVIERIRASLNSRIESGHVRVGSRHNFKELGTKSISGHPSVGIIALAPLCDVSIIDERFLNQHTNFDSGGAQAPVFTTLDLLDALVATGVLSDDDCLEHRTRLRKAGYFFVPISVEELERCLRESTVVKGKVVETAELKSIRESVLRVRMSDWLWLPEEAPWLDGTLKAFVRVVRNLWVDGADIEEITARSNWLVEQFDVRGWAHSLVPENADNVVRVERAAYILLMTPRLPGVQQCVLDAYWSWMEERILLPVQEHFPEVFEWLVNWHRSQIAEVVKTQTAEGDNS